MGITLNTTTRFRPLVEVVDRLGRSFQPDEIYLFGSWARGEQGPDSDYDLMVIVPDDAPPERRDSRLGYEVLRGTGLAVDVHVWSRSAFDRRLHLRSSLPSAVRREGTSLYEG